MKAERSNQVVDSYKQNKLNVSVMARIRRLVDQFEEDYAANRRWAWIGVLALVGFLLVAVYLFVSGSQITIS